MVGTYSEGSSGRHWVAMALAFQGGRMTFGESFS